MKSFYLDFALLLLLFLFHIFYIIIVVESSLEWRTLIIICTNEAYLDLAKKGKDWCSPSLEGLLNWLARGLNLRINYSKSAVIKSKFLWFWFKSLWNLMRRLVDVLFYCDKYIILLNHCALCPVLHILPRKTINVVRFVFISTFIFIITFSSYGLCLIFLYHFCQEFLNK